MMMTMMMEKKNKVMSDRQRMFSNQNKKEEKENS